MSEEKTTLFGLVGEYKELYDMLMNSDEEDKEVVETTLESVEFEIEQKAEDYLAVIDRIDMELAAAEKQKEFWTRAVNTRKNAKKWMIDRVTSALMQLGVNEIQAGAKKFKLVKNGGQLPLVLDDERTVPEAYTKLILEPDKEKIRSDLESGKELDFAHLGERGSHLAIK